MRWAVLLTVASLALPPSAVAQTPVAACPVANLEVSLDSLRLPEPLIRGRTYRVAILPAIRV